MLFPTEANEVFQSVLNKLLLYANKYSFSPADILEVGVCLICFELFTKAYSATRAYFMVV